MDRCFMLLRLSGMLCNSTIFTKLVLRAKILYSELGMHYLVQKVWLKLIIFMVITDGQHYKSILLTQFKQRLALITKAGCTLYDL